MFSILLFQSQSIFAIESFSSVHIASKQKKDSLVYNTTYRKYKANDLSTADTRLFIKEKAIETFSDQELFTLLTFVEGEIENGNFDYAESLIGEIENLNNLNQIHLLVISYVKAMLLYSKKDYSHSVRMFESITNEPHIENVGNIYRNAYYYLGQNYNKFKRYQEAIFCFNKTLEYKGLTDVSYYDGCIKLARTYYLLGETDEAIISLNKHNDELTKMDNTGKSNLLISKIYQLRAFLYREKALNDADSLNLLKLSFNDCKQSVVLINKYIQNQNFESDQLKFNNTYNYFFYKTIEASDRVYEIEPHDSLLYQGFYYAELDKNLALLRYLQKKTLQQELNIPHHDILALDSLSYALLKTEEVVYNYELEDEVVDSVLLKLYADKRMLMEELSKKEENISAAYPIYRDQKYRLPAFDTAFLNTLSYEKQIVEYLISDEKVYSFFISQGKIHQHHFEFDDSLFFKIEEFRQLTGDVKHINFSRKEYVRFCDLGNELYTLLLKPYEHLFNDKPLLVIPDNELNLIPFEALLTSGDYPENPDYAKLPYLMQKFAISYANSIELLKYQSTSDDNNLVNESVLSYAPSYNKLKGNKSRQYIALRDARDELGNLPGARAEVEGINKIMASNTQISSKASEASFKQESNKYAVVHCAMHALVNNDNPMFSKLVFTPNVDKVEDGLLNTYEIGQSDLNAKMVVLSACNTGYGKINKGEGLLSLSRGFIQAGCKSILSTLWSVSDISGVDLMRDFYNGIAQNQLKSESLTNAKRLFLKNNTGIDAHPYFWAGYILTGNDATLKLEAPRNNKYYLYAIPLLLLFVLVFYRRKQLIKIKGIRS